MIEKINFIFSQIKKISRIYLLSLITGCIGLIFLIYGLFSYFHSENTNTITENKDSVIAKEQNTSTNSVKIVKSIKIDIEGAVIKPGVYDLPENSRVQDSLIAAGGLSQNADRDYIQKHINLAAKITDAAKIYIPKDTDHNSQSLNSQVNSDASVVLGDSAMQININAASLETLDSLPGIGQITAQKIISGRPYDNIEEVLTKKIVSQKVFSQIKDKIAAF